MNIAHAIHESTTVCHGGPTLLGAANDVSIYTKCMACQYGRLRDPFPGTAFIACMDLLTLGGSDTVVTSN